MKILQLGDAVVNLIAFLLKGKAEPAFFMRAKISLVGFIVIFPVLLPAQQVITVTPQALTGWTITGAAQRVLGSEKSLTVPAGSQLARTFAGTELSLSVATRPVIGITPEDWPVLQIGSTALVFARRGTNGTLLLVVGENVPKELPFAFKLDATGRTTEALVIDLTRQGSKIMIVFSGQAEQMLAGSNEVSPEVIATAGSSQLWAFDQLDVAVDPIVPTSTVASGVSLSRPSNSVNFPPLSLLNSGASGPVPVINPAGLSRFADLGGKKASSASSTGAQPADTSEMSTPTSVRLLHIKAVRAAAAEAVRQ